MGEVLIEPISYFEAVEVSMNWQLQTGIRKLRGKVLGESDLAFARVEPRFEGCPELILV